jgi:hypothetical protein
MFLSIYTLQKRQPVSALTCYKQNETFIYTFYQLFSGHWCYGPSQIPWYGCQGITACLYEEPFP